MQYIEYVTGQEALELAKRPSRLDLGLDFQFLYWTSSHPTYSGKLWETANVDTMTQYWRFGETIVKTNILVATKHAAEVFDELYITFGLKSPRKAS